MRSAVAGLSFRLALLALMCFPIGGASSAECIAVRLSWGHRSPVKADCFMRIRGQEVSLDGFKGEGCEPQDVISGETARSKAGNGDVDGLVFQLHYIPAVISPITNLHSIWKYLVEHSDSSTADRLLADPGNRPDSRQITIQLNEAGTRGFSITLDQLLRNKAFWVPELDVFVGLEGETFTNTIKELEPFHGTRIQDMVAKSVEPTYADFKHLWEDMGSPVYRNPNSIPPGHIICLSWDGSQHKFGIDRGGGVHSDYGSPDPFHFRYSIGDISRLSTESWTQALADGLPIITTTTSRDGVRYGLEQFAYPLGGPPTNRRGDVPLVLFQRLQLESTLDEPSTVTIKLDHQRKKAQNPVVLETRENTLLCLDAAKTCLFTVQGEGVTTLTSQSVMSGTDAISLNFSLPPRAVRELILKLPSPVLAGQNLETLLRMDYGASKGATLSFWSTWLAKGAQFQVPDESVNQLFRANLWHALRLSRRGGIPGEAVRLDLPYSNFAYDQKGIPWPVNQVVYVDYMLYDLRGYHSNSAEELEQMFLQNQESNGHIKGFANWGVYTPGMLYAVSKHYLLSGDGESFGRLLPQTLRAFDWCLDQIRKAADRSGAGHGLVLGPLNDLSHEDRAWAFNQAYLFAGPELFGRALEKARHPRAAEARAAARLIYGAVQDQFGRASLESPLVQLRDRTWIPYVPSDALSRRRPMHIWYPTEVDTGALHLSRLGALDPLEELTTYLLADHEDNLLLGGLSMANEPVYNQHATAWLMRDNAPMVVRAFYSMMACAFSHSVFEPVEHRWGWGQYFGPPSTDGAWFELYRNMLVRETEDDTLFLMQATPRPWLADGLKIRVQGAPTYYGNVNFSVVSAVNSNKIRAEIEMPPREKPTTLQVRFRHPENKSMRSVRVNREIWRDFDPEKEWVRIPAPSERRYTIEASY
jgi:hypothetical protein